MPNQTILSICVPIYNRIDYLDRMLSRFLEDKSLFGDIIHLYISDNCSQDDIKSVCDDYSSRGLALTYSRNERNIGMDGNFVNCFNHAQGKYVWILGSDDIPNKGLLERLIRLLDSGDYGLVHLSMRPQEREFSVYSDHNLLLTRVAHWITFLSGNIIRTDSLKGLDLTSYEGTFITQVPAYLNACCSFSKNAILYLPSFFDGGDDSLNNGGYNVFKVFVGNLFQIFEDYINKGLLSRKAFFRVIKIEYKEFLIDFIIRLLIFRKASHFNLEGSWRCLIKYYGYRPYAYYYLFTALMRHSVRLLLNRILKTNYK